MKPSLVKPIKVVRGDVKVGGEEQNIGAFVVFFLEVVRGDVKVGGEEQNIGAFVVFFLEEIGKSDIMLK